MPEKNIQELLLNDEIERYPDVARRHRPDRVAEYSRTEDGQTVTFVSENRVRLAVSVLTPDIFRLSYSMPGDPDDDFSYAIDPEFQPEETEVRVEEKKGHYRISGPSISCRVAKEKMLVSFHDSDSSVICEDRRGYYRRDTLMRGITEVSISHKAPDDAEYYGLGDKACALNLRGTVFENWNTDSFSYERGDDPVYRSIPFYMALTGGRAYGIFFDNSYRTRFNFDRNRSGTTKFSAEGGKADYYFINGPELLDVARRYTRLTGRPELPPLWSLGYHQCRWSYYPESTVRDIAAKFRNLEIPCDAIYLDIDYMENYKVFTWNKKHFPNPKQLIRDLKEDGFRTVVMIDPGILIEEGYKVYEEGLEKDYFCKRPDGELMIGPVWPPRCVFPDYTRPEVREWWGDLYDEFMNGLSVSGIWNDMNEPAVFEVESKTFSGEIRHDYDGHPCSHRKAHNIYGMQMARASMQGIRKHVPDKRPFLLTRSNFSGGQRYAALWTGDNIATWDHLRLANEQCQRLSISGFSFCGSDIGGFAETPSPELFVRWIQLGIFHPLFRTHSMGFNVDGAAAVNQDEVEKEKSKEMSPDQEPWSFGKKATERSREAINLRYRLLQYLYTAFHEYVTDGTPVLKPMVYFDQADPEAGRHPDEFVVGGQLLVSPVLKKGQKQKEVYLPGESWYHYWDDERLAGTKTHKIDAPLDRIPLFVKAGAVLPMRELMQYTDERKPEKLTLLAYHPGDNSRAAVTSPLYEDAGEGYGYREGDYRKTRFTLEGSDTGLKLSAEREGEFTPAYKVIELVLIGLPFTPGTGSVDGSETKPEEITRNGKKAWRMSVSPDFSEVTVKA